MMSSKSKSNKKEEQDQDLSCFANDLSDRLSLHHSQLTFIVPTQVAHLKACKRCGLLKAPEKVSELLFSGVRTRAVRTAGPGPEMTWRPKSPTGSKSTFGLTQHHFSYQSRGQLAEKDLQRVEKGHGIWILCALAQLMISPLALYSIII